MIVCVCNRINDRTITQAIEAGADSIEALSMELGVCCGCGCCRQACESLLDEHAERTGMPLPLAA